MTRLDLPAIAAWNTANERARRAYHADPTQEQLALAHAKAVRKAAAQARYNARRKESNT